MKAEQWVSRVLERRGLHTAPMPGISLVEMVGDHRVLVENHCGVTEYGRDFICIRLKQGCLQITGDGLNLSHMNRGQLVITGRIECIRNLGR